MALKRKVFKRACLVCDTRFQTINKRKINCCHLCGVKAYRYRVMQKLERLHRIEQGVM